MDYSETMAKQSNEQLLKIINAPEGDYLSEAIVAAGLELNKRNLTLEDTKVAEDKLRDMAVEEKAKEEQSLEWYWKIMAFLPPGLILLILFLILGSALSQMGYYKKASDIKKWTIRGILFHLGLFVILILAGIIFS